MDLRETVLRDFCKNNEPAKQALEELLVEFGHAKADVLWLKEKQERCREAFILMLNPDHTGVYSDAPSKGHMIEWKHCQKLARGILYPNEKNE